MNSLVTDKYERAWAKLADVIARGEKERALGMFRLLSQSFDNTALALQLEGDILWAFNDDRAASKYEQAGRLYFQQGKKLQAIAIYEHIILLSPDNSEYLSTLIDWYTLLNHVGKQIEYSVTLFKLFLKKKEYTKALSVLNRIDGVGRNRSTINEIQRSVFVVLPEAKSIHSDLLACIQKIIDWSIINNDQQLLQSFFVQLESVSQKYYCAVRQL